MRDRSPKMMDRFSSSCSLHDLFSARVRPPFAALGLETFLAFGFVFSVVFFEVLPMVFFLVGALLARLTIAILVLPVALIEEAFGLSAAFLDPMTVLFSDPLPAPRDLLPDPVFSLRLSAVFPFAGVDRFSLVLIFEVLFFVTIELLIFRNYHLLKKFALMI
ncbi:MAG: hypothetical protein KJ645_11175 [Planctomycetes bacterium]|nr:hypothetical protein [Planctomycetota bacterium]